MNQPKLVKVEAFSPDGKPLMVGPQKEEVPGDPFENNARVIMPFNGSSGSGDVTGEVVYANYGRLEDFDQLAAEHIDLHGKIVMVRYGANFRGVKVYIAEQRGAAGRAHLQRSPGRRLLQGRCLPGRPLAPGERRAARVGAYLFKYPGYRKRPARHQRRICRIQAGWMRMETSRTLFQFPSAIAMRSRF